jgi:hypothetical protein
MLQEKTAAPQTSFTWASLPSSFSSLFILVYYVGFLQTYKQIFPAPVKQIFNATWRN